MCGRRTSIASLFLFAGLAQASAADYFPLEAGNQWIYRAAGKSQTMTVEVVRTVVMANRAYSYVTGFPEGDLYLRMGDDGTMYSYNAETGKEGVWAAFGAAEGTEYDTVIGSCNRRARIASRAAKYEGVVGSFTTALRIVYPPASCADAGITEEFYLPWVGLVRRIHTTIAGPVAYELIYAQLGGVTVIAGQGLGFGVAIDRALYTVNLMPPVDATKAVPEMTLRMTLHNWTGTAVDLNFGSGQSYDVVIRNSKNETVYQWSEGKAFTMVFRYEKLGPRQERSYVVIIPLAGKDGQPLPHDTYTVEAWLAAGNGKLYSATTAFQIQTVY